VRPIAASSAPMNSSSGTGSLCPMLNTRYGAREVAGSGLIGSNDGSPCGGCASTRTTPSADVIHVGEVAAHVAVVEHVDRASGEDRVGEQERRHIGRPHGP
jgi:hypothetical protein